MKPETVARRRAERLEATAARRVDLERRLRALAERDGVTSIWAELLEEHAGKGAA